MKLNSFPSKAAAIPAAAPAAPMADMAPAAPAAPAPAPVAPAISQKTHNPDNNLPGHAFHGKRR
jgi:hypothetical protein